MMHSSVINDLRKSLKSELGKLNKPRLPVIINGEYWRHAYVGLNPDGTTSRRVALVYVKLVSENFTDPATMQKSTRAVVQFAFRDSSKNVDVELVTWENDLNTKLSKNFLSIEDSIVNKIPEGAHVEVNSQWGVAHIYSNLYHVADTIARRSTVVDTSSFALNNCTLERVEVNRLINQFTDYQYCVYRDLVYTRTSGGSRFINKFLHNQKLYSVLRAYVPVFVDISFLYNPMLHGNSRIEESRLYKMAKEKGRYLEINDISSTGSQDRQVSSCYLLTHLEICEALGLKNFVRFTPDFLYKLIVGMIRTDLDGFPGTGCESYRIISKDAVYNTPLKSKYTEERYQAELKSYIDKRNEAIQNGKTDEAEVLEATVNLLVNYTQVDALMIACMESVSGIAAYGAYVLDKDVPVNRDNLYKFVLERRLFW